MADGIIAGDAADDLVLVAAVWVNLQAADETMVQEDNRTATRDAPAAGALQLPPLDEALEYRDRALNACYLPPGIT